MATNGHSGYPLKWFKDQNAARNSFECAICLEVLEDPVQVRDCGHQFCALCIDDILKRDRRCPSCRISISRAMVFEDHAARRLIKKLHVNCCNEGCSWVGDLSSLLEAHMNSCNFLVHSASGSSVKQSDVEILEAKLESLIFEVSTLKEKHRNDMEQVSAKHEADLKEIKIKHDQEVRQLREQMAFVAEYTNLPPTYLQTLEQLTLNPTVTVALKIPNFKRKLNEAKSSNSYGRIDSDPFYTSHGYRMKISVYLNEGPCGHTGYMGVYFYLMQGDCDDSLKWPFDKPVTFIVVDQQNDESQIESFEGCLIPNGEKALNKPLVESNEGLGFGEFMLHSALRSRQYVRNHTVYIAVAVEP